MAWHEDLTEEDVDPDNLFLDPYNPRFTSQPKEMNEERMRSDTVQGAASQKIECQDIERMIKEQGFLPMDRIVVVKFPDNEEFFLVLEGNRRTKAVKSVRAAYNAGDIEEKPETWVESVNEIPVLSLPSSYFHEEDTRWQVQGARHHTGIAGWPKSRQDIHIVKQIDAGKNSVHVSGLTGLHPSDVTEIVKGSRRWDAVLENAGDYEDDLEANREKFYNYFAHEGWNKHIANWTGFEFTIPEGTKLPNGGTFSNPERLQSLIKWITQDPPQVPSMISLRDFKKLAPLNNNFAEELDDMDEDDTLTLSAAIERMKIRKRGESQTPTPAPEDAEPDYVDIDEIVNEIVEIVSVIAKLRTDIDLHFPNDFSDELQERVNVAVRVINERLGSNDS